MNNLKCIAAIYFYFLGSLILYGQLGISHPDNDHSTLASVHYEPYSDYDTFLIRYGKFIIPNMYIAANIGYSPGVNHTPLGRQPRDLFTAGIDTEYLLTSHIAQFPFGISITGKYQYEFHHDGTNESEHHFDLKANAYYPFRYKKVSLSPYGSYGISDFSFRKFTNTRCLGGIIGYHFSKSDYCYLLIYSQRYDYGTEASADHRIFVSLGLLW